MGAFNPEDYAPKYTRESIKKSFDKFEEIPILDRTSLTEEKREIFSLLKHCLKLYAEIDQKEEQLITAYKLKRELENIEIDPTIEFDEKKEKAKLRRLRDGG